MSGYRRLALLLGKCLENSLTNVEQKSLSLLSRVTAGVRLSGMKGVNGSPIFGVLCGAEEMNDTEAEAGSKVTVLIAATDWVTPAIVAATVTAVSVRGSLSVDELLAGISSSNGF